MEVMRKAGESCPLCGLVLQNEPKEDQGGGAGAEGEEEEEEDPQDLLPLIILHSKSTHNHSYLKDLISKHLQIKIKDNRVENVCILCKQTIFDWDKFVQKCWSVQNLLEDTKVHCVKSETDTPVEVKIETYDNGDYEEDYSLLQCDFKNEDPLMRIQKDGDKTESVKKNCFRTKRKNRKLILTSETDEIDVDRSKEINDVKATKKKRKKSSMIIDFSCYICNAKIGTWPSLVRHFSDRHPSDRVQVLCICGKFLRNAKTVNNHANIHDETRGYKCSECSRKFSCRQNLRDHMFSHFPDKDNRYDCPHCSKEFYVHAVFQKHVKTHLPPEIRYTFACDICGEKFASNGNLKAHKLSVHEKTKDHICDLCGKSFTLKGTLDGHKRTKHNDSRDFECEKCHRRFKVKDELKRHIMNTHSNRPMKCPLCPAVLKNMRTYRRHKDIHDNIYKYSCNLCGKQFRKSEHLKNHMNTHDGVTVRSYVCQWCSMSYASKQSLLNHMNKTHPDILIESYLSKMDSGA